MASPASLVGDEALSAPLPAEIPLPAAPFEETSLLAFPGLSRFPGLVHCITTRPWNLAPHREADREQVIDRRRRLCAHLGMPFERLTAPDQIHSAHVLRVLPSDVGAGRWGRETAIQFVDGLVTNLPETPLLQLSGDCALILVYDPRRHAIGAGHASWRGTVAGIATQVVAAMRREFGSDPIDLWAGISPSAGRAAYAVGESVARIVRAMLADHARVLSMVDGRTMFDLKGASAAQLMRAGIPGEQIEVAAECTISDARFFSHRRDGASTGRFGMIAGLRG